MNLIAICPFGATELTVNGLHQWDYGRKLEIHADDLPAMVEVHFACPGMDEAIVRVGSAADGTVTVAIPDRCLEQPLPITAWVYEVGETSGQTIKTITLNVTARLRPQIGESVDPEIIDKYTEAVAAMNELIEKMPDQFLLKKGGRMTGRLFVEADLLEVGNYFKSNELSVVYLNGPTPGSVIGVLGFFGNGSQANGASENNPVFGVRGIYDHLLHKNILEITGEGKDGKVTFSGSADNADHATEADHATNAVNATYSTYAEELALDRLYEIKDYGAKVMQRGLYLVVLENNSLDYESRVMYIHPNRKAEVRECYDLEAKISYTPEGGFYVDPQAYRIERIYVLCSATIEG